MKFSKHILKLAEQQFNFELNEYRYLTEEHRKEQIELNALELTRIKNALLKGNFYCRVERVSSSGMSRKISLAYTYKNKIRSISDTFLLKLAGCDKNGRIGGCGMDMLFHAQYTLFQNLHRSYKEAHYQKRLARYNTY